MANPVMNSIVKDWSTQQTTPAGYPTMPGYQPASQQAPNPYAGQTNPYAAQQAPAYGQRPVTAIRRPTASSREHTVIRWPPMRR